MGWRMRITKRNKDSIETEEYAGTSKDLSALLDTAKDVVRGKEAKQVTITEVHIYQE